MELSVSKFFSSRYISLCQSGRIKNNFRSPASLYILFRLYFNNNPLRFRHAGGSDAADVLHGFLRRMAVDAVYAVHAHAVQRQLRRCKGRVAGGDSLHHAALVPAVADHARQAGRHVADHTADSGLFSSAQQAQPAGRSRAAGQGAAAQGGQPPGIRLDVHADQIAQGGGPQRGFLGKAVDLHLRRPRRGFQPRQQEDPAADSRHFDGDQARRHDFPGRLQVPFRDGA